MECSYLFRQGEGSTRCDLCRWIGDIPAAGVFRVLVATSCVCLGVWARKGLVDVKLE